VDALRIDAGIDGASAIIIAFRGIYAFRGRNAFAIRCTNADVLCGVAGVIRAVVELGAFDGRIVATIFSIARIVVTGFARADDGGGDTTLGEGIESDFRANVGGRAIDGSNASTTRTNSTARVNARVLGYGTSSSSNTFHKAR